MDALLKLALGLNRDAKYEEFEVQIEEEPKKEKEEEVKLDDVKENKPGEPASANETKDDDKKVDL
jgi:hypothetical protein